MNIKSKNGSINISGTDVKVGNDLDLNAKKDITIKASEENYTSSNSSSQTGISLSSDLSIGKIADLSVSKAGTKGRGNGTNYVNSTVNVDGKLKTESENLTISGANVEADKLDIKAKNLVIESKQDKSERKDSSSGGSFSIDLANPSSFSANINGSKGSGEKDWVNKQSTLIGRNGGKVDTDSLTNIGAVIGSESEKEKLKISANKVVVKDLEDKNKYENIGGGINFGTDVPNILVKHDNVDKEQINRATAINTELTINNEEKTAEDLGFNTDINKSQEKTKDEEKHLDAELHTDLIGEDKRNEIKYAYKKLGSLHEILEQKKFKESMEGVLVDKFKDEHQKEFNLIKDENLSLEDKQKLAQNLVEGYLRENGYQGVIPEVLLTDEAHSFTVDSKDKITGAKRGEKIYFSINDIANPDLAFSQLFGHEKAHMNTYDEGKDGEETSIHTREKIGSENKNKVFTEEEKADYLNNLRNKYKNQKSIEQQFAEAKLVPEKDKEHWMITVSEGLSVGMGYYLNFNGSVGAIINEKNGKVYVVATAGGTLGGGTPSIGYTSGVNIYPFINNPEEVSGFTKNIGGKVLNIAGVDVNFGKTRTSIGIGKSFKLEGKLSKLSGTANVEGLLGEAFPSFKNILNKYELHGGASYTQLIGAVEITNKEFLSKLEKKGGVITKSPENILKIVNYLKENPDKLKVLDNTIEKLVEKKRAIDPYE